MRGLALIGLLLFLGGCSCSRKPVDRPVATTDPTTAEAAAVNAKALAAQAADAKIAEAQATAMSDAVSATHAYLALVAAKDWAQADAYWTGGKPSPRPDDYSVRAIEDLRSLRINNDSPKPLDTESPTRSVEVPVTLRVRKDNGIYELKGWYRLRQKVGGEGWEITSASLQPSMG